MSIIETLKVIGAAHRKSVAQVALRWEFQQGIVPISKSLNPDRMKQNSEIFDFQLTEQEMKAITDLGEEGRTGPDPDNISF